MNGNIVNYLEGILPSLPPEIISPETYSKLYKLCAVFQDFAASEYIMETSLNKDAAEADFSFRILTGEKPCLTKGLRSDIFSTLSANETWMRIIEFVKDWPQDIEDVWLEMDYGECDKDIPQPCFFFNASQVKKGHYVDHDLLFGALKHLLDQEQLDKLRVNLKGVIDRLPTEVGLFQVGAMLARNRDRVRIFTGELTREQTVQYLDNIGWASLSQLDRLFEAVHQYSDGQYILDFDVSEQGASEKIGINFGLGKTTMLLPFMEGLVEQRWCTDIKKRGVLSWSGCRGSFLGDDYGYTALIKDISHFKISYSPEEGFKAKAYLRVAGIYLKELLKAKAVPNWLHAGEQQAEIKQPGYKEMQNIFKKIAQKAMLEKDFRQLCLSDSKAAIQKMINGNAVIPDNIVFLEEDGDGIEDGFAYVLPPFIKPSWLSGK
ncbi:hypothetical protein ASZ90_019989 [hydrocarbon metagenome]|uniref:Uncharacterized protein n=1 Tax=hydrocarbon metagenome TaxID=938273 RepID=A0A0W8E2G6_9ZZZZ